MGFVLFKRNILISTGRASLKKNFLNAINLSLTKHFTSKQARWTQNFKWSDSLRTYLKCALSLIVSGELTAHLIEVCGQFDQVRLQKSIKGRFFLGASTYIYIYTISMQRLGVRTRTHTHTYIYHLYILSHVIYTYIIYRLYMDISIFYMRVVKLKAWHILWITEAWWQGVRGDAASGRQAWG